MKDHNFPQALSSPIFEAFCQSVDKQYIYICDVKTNVWRWSPYSVEYFGLPSDTIYNFPDIWLKKVHPEDREKLSQVFEELFSGKSLQHSCEYRVKNAKGDYVWVLCRGCMAYDEQGNMDVCAGILTHLGENNKFDSNTGLLSIHEFRQTLVTLIQQPKIRFGILIFGLDYFRRLNEAINFSFGNAVLGQYAKELAVLQAKKIKLFRMDGDKFAFLYQDGEKQDLESLFAKVFDIAQKGVLVDGKHISFTVSAGAILYPENCITADELYTSMEYALEYAKKNNREGLTFFTDYLQKETADQFRLQQTLKECIEHNFEGFYMCYQPTVTADEAHSLIGAEALLRWYHPEFGFVSPTVFIPILEETGKIIPVGKWVFSTALYQVKKWMDDKPHMKISINVSLIQLLDDNFRQFVLAEVAKCNFPKEQLILELTESCNVIQPDKVREELNFFRESGIQIALDDFGTGYASLSVLRDLAADWVKVDYSFVAQIAQSDFDQALTESLINLCKRLDFDVCVEGIETEEIEKIIQNYNPTTMQGYLFSKPLETAQFEEQYIKNVE